MTGDAILSPAAAAVVQPLFRVPATAIFHHGRDPAIWVIRPDSTLELRAVTVDRYTERGAAVSSGLKDGDQVVLAGVHTVYAGELVKSIKPLFDGEGDAPPTAAGPGRAAAAR